MTAAVPLRAPAAEDELLSLARIAEALDASGLALEAREIAGRLAEGRFHVACLGQFKRGKSSLLNALLGEAVLPMGVVPITSAITVLRHGPRRAMVTFADGRSEQVEVGGIARYVSERQNPENQLGVRAVEVFLPAPLLEGGMCLVDTPGLGSVFEGNDAVTRQFVPQIDAALVVIGADPPITADEVALIEAVAPQARHLVLALNKADRLTEAEREEGVAFATDVLARRLRRPVGHVFQVSALERLEAGHPTRELADLAGALAGLARGAGQELLSAARARAVARLGRALLAEIAERRAALRRPLEESEARLTGLERQAAQAERSLADLGALLAAEEARLTRAYVARHEGFFPSAQAEARSGLDAFLASLAAPRRRIWDEATEEARRRAREVASRFRAELEPEAEAAYQAAMRRFVDLANAFLAEVGAQGGWAVTPRPLGDEAGFRVRSELWFTDLRSSTSRLPFAPLLDLLRPRALVVHSARRAAQALLARLVETNASRVTYDLAGRAAQSRARLERDVRGRLQEALDAARRASQVARQRRAEGEAAVRGELTRLDVMCSELEPLVAARSHGGETP